MKKVLASVVLAAFLTTGCTGSFNLTRKVYNFHRAQSDKWMDELVFLVVAILPVYGIATFVDAVIVNSIEFWTGENPVDMASVNKDLNMAFNKDTNQVLVSPNGKDQLVLEKSDQMVLAKNTKGDVLFSSMKNEAGDISVYDSKGKLVKTYSASDVSAMKENRIRN